MSGNEEILANFQSITAIDDVGEAIMHLEECNWDLYAAIHRVLPVEDAGPAPEPFPVPPAAASFQNLVHPQPENNLNDVPPLVSNVLQPSPLGNRNIYGPDLSTTPDRSANASYSSLAVGPAFPSPESSAAAAINGRNNASTSSRVSRVKELIFNVKHNFNVHIIRISNTATVGDLKARIASLTQVPACRQALTGWLSVTADHQRNATVLRALPLALQNNLTLTDISTEGYADGLPTGEPRQLATFTIRIQRLPEGTEIVLNFPGTQTLHQVKSDVYTVTDIPVRHQDWTGWPVGMTNEMTLAGTAGVSLNHSVVLRSLASNRASTSAYSAAAAEADAEAAASSVASLETYLRATNNSQLADTSRATVDASSGSGRISRSNSAAAQANGAAAAAAVAAVAAPANAEPENVILIDSDDSEFEDATDEFNADEDMFDDPEIVRNRLKDLIIDNIDDEKTGSMQFVENYVQRYGSPHPEFFIGSLEEAMNEACQKRISQRKLLAIYLHDDRSVLTNVFCDQLLKCDSIMQTLQHNFVLYGWDLTHESNKHLFLSALTCVGVTATMTVRALLVSELPSILIVGRTRSTHEVLSIIHGNVSREELLNKLIDTINMYGEQREVELREENERAAREAVKMEQDEAYNESLEADRRKEEAKRQREQAEESERQRADAERIADETQREDARMAAESAVPAEPPAGTAGCTKIRVRQPNGGAPFERRFDGHSKLQDLLMFVASKGFPQTEWKLISSYPRRDLTALDANETLSHYKLCPQETVILEER